MQGACPGTLLSQLGSWKPEIVYTFPGAVCGALFYGGGFQSVVERAFPAREMPGTLAGLFGLPYWPVSIGMMGGLLSVMLYLERFSPWVHTVDDFDDLDFNSSLASLAAHFKLKQKAWQIDWVGSLIGALHAPFFVWDKAGLGMSSGIMAIAGVTALTLGVRTPNLLDHLVDGRNVSGVLIMNAGIIVGSALSSKSSGTFATRVKAFSPGEKCWLFVGGFLMIVGARMASGCISGRGLAGTLVKGSGRVAEHE